MRIIVCIKQVPDTNEVKINRETGTLIRDGVPSIINPDDMNALEEALRLKDMNGAEVIVLSMGPYQAISSIKEALAMGADKGYLISDRSFGGSDTWATATIITSAIEKIGNYDLIFCGRQAIDGDTAQVGPEIAEFLNIPQVTYAKKIRIDNEDIIATRYTEYGDITYTVKTPVLITAIKDLNEPRYPQIRKIYEVYDSSNENIEVLGINDLDNIDITQIGLKGSPTNVYKSFVPVRDKNSDIIEGSSNKEKAEKLVYKLKNLNLI